MALGGKKMDDKDIITKSVMVIAGLIILLQIAGAILGKDYHVGATLFIATILGGIFLIYKAVAQVGEKTETEDWILMGAVLILIIGILIIFRGIIPSQFLGAVENIASMIGAP